MARRQKKRARAKGATAIDDILAGRVKVTLADAFPLINTINPTGRGLDDNQSAARYEKKTRLVEHVISSFGPHLLVERDPSDPTVVSIQRTERRSDACHIKIEALGDDARGWVRDQLDDALLGTPEDDAPAGVPQTRSAVTADGAALVRARAALDDYDYEEAERLFEAAFEYGLDGALEGLLELYVDYLAADEDTVRVFDAVDLKDASPNARCLAALSAARLGRAKEALAWIQGLDERRAGDVLAEVARRAIAEGRVYDAAKAHASLVSKWPAHEARLELEDDLSRARSEARAPQEAEARALLASGDLDAAHALASRTRSQWPDSQEAARILREVDRLRREAKRAELTARAADEEREGRLTSALALLAHADRLGADVGAHLVELRARIERDAEEAALANLIELLKDDRTSDAMTAYLALDPSSRTRARELRDHDAFRRIDIVLASSPRAKAAAVAAAAHAWLEADAALARGEPPARTTLSPHLRLLEPVAKKTLDAIDKAEAQQRDVAAAEILDATRSALDAGDLAGARTHLQRVKSRRLSAPCTERLETLLHALKAAEQFAGHRAAYEAALEHGAYFEARRELDALRSRTSTDERGRWDEEATRIDRALADDWRLLVVPAPAPDLLAYFELTHVDERPAVGLTDDGRSAFVVSVRGRWLFICRIDTTDGRPVEAALMRTPEALEFINYAVADDVLTICGSSGGWLQLRWTDWRILAWSAVAAVVSGDERIENLQPIAGTQSAWLEVSNRSSHRFHTKLVDIDAMRVVRTLGEGLRAVVLNRGGRKCAALAPRGGLTLIDGRGRGDREFLPKYGCTAIAPHPGGHGYLVVCTPEEDAGGEIRIVSIDHAGVVKAENTVEDSSTDWRHAFVAGAGDLAALLWLGPHDQNIVTTWRVHGHAFEDRHDIVVPNDIVLLSDQSCQHIALVSTMADRSVRLTPGTVVEAFETPTSPRLPRSILYLDCASSEDTPPKPHLDELREAVRRVHPAKWKRWLKRFEEEHASDPDRLEACAQAIAEGNPRRWEDAQRLRRQIIERFPEHGTLVLAYAEHALVEKKHHEALDLLEPAAERLAMEGHAMHTQHLLGVLKLQLGDIHGAKDHFDAAASEDEGDCDLGVWTELVDALLETQLDDPTTGPPSIAVLVASLRIADRAIQAGDHAEVEARLLLPWTLGLKCPGIQLRLAHAFLNREPDDACGRFVKTMVLATAINENDRDGRHILDVCVPPPVPKDIVDRCKDWLRGRPL